MKLSPEAEALIGKLKQWCEAERGRRSEFARIIGVTPQTVKNWLDGNNEPRASETLTIIEFLENPEKFRKPGRGLAKK
jgi:DNA-binding transcriptional regulator YiaG